MKQFAYSFNVTLIALFLLTLMTVGLLVGIEAWQTFLFCLVNITGVLFPGYLLVRWSDFHFKNNTSLLLVSYGVGFAVMAILYAILLICGFHQSSGWVMWGVSLMCVLTLLSSKIRHDMATIFMGTNRDLVFIEVLFLVLIVFCLILFQRPLSSVEFTGYQDIPYDHMYWMKNCVAATKDYPLPELSVSGYKMYWHMFSCFNIAMFHFATGIQIFYLCFSLSCVWEIILLLGGTYALANELLKDRRYVFTALIMMLLCSSAEYYTHIQYLIHLWFCTMGTPEAIASELLCILLLLKAIEGQQINWKRIPLVVLLALSATGYKSPIGLIMLVGIGSVLLIQSMRNRRAAVSSLTVLLIISLLSILVIKVFVASDQTLTSPYSNNQVTLTFRTATQVGMMQGLVSLLTDFCGMEIHVVSLLLTIPCMLVVHPVMPLLAFLLIMTCVKRNQIHFSNEILFYIIIPLLIMCMAGIAAFLLFTHYGFAQSYFLYAIIPLAVILSMMVIEKYSWLENDLYRSGLYLYIGCTLVILPVCVLNYEHEELRHAPSEISREGTSLTTNEWKGLTWTRDHLPETAVIVTNKVLAPKRGNKSYITSCYTERQVYFEGYISANLPNDYIVKDRLELIANYFGGDLKARDTLKKEGVTHVVIYKSLSDIDKVSINWGGVTNTLIFNPLSESCISQGETLFENEEIKVTTL